MLITVDLKWVLIFCFQLILPEFISNEKNSFLLLETNINSLAATKSDVLREKYDLSLESNENTKEEGTELSDEAKVTLERIKKGEVFTL